MLKKKVWTFFYCIRLNFKYTTYNTQNFLFFCKKKNHVFHCLSADWRKWQQLNLRRYFFARVLRLGRVLFFVFFWNFELNSDLELEIFFILFPSIFFLIIIYFHLFDIFFKLILDFTYRFE